MKDESVRYVKISEMVKDKYCNVYGAIVGWLECRESRGSDFVMTLDLIDDSTVNKLSVKVFSRTKIFAEGFCVGDIVRVRNLKLYDVNKAITDHKNEIEIVHTCLSSLETADARTRELMHTFSARKHEFVREKLVSEVRDNQYFDFCGELVDKQMERHNLVVLRFVDYTSNPQVSGDAQGFYPSSMVLVVKAWGSFAQLAEGCEIGECYRVKNLRIDGIGDLLVANLSESRKGNIIKISRNTTFCRCLELRKRMHNERSFQTVTDAPVRMMKYRLSRIKDVCYSGIHRVRIQIKRYTPFNGIELLRCRGCDVAMRGNQFKCLCEQPMVEKMKLLKLLVYDRSGEAVVVCRNQVVECLFDAKNIDYLNGVLFDGIIASVLNIDRMSFNLIDAGFCDTLV